MEIPDQPMSIVPTIPKERRSEAVQKLQSLLDPAVLQAVPQPEWDKLDSQTAKWLLHNVADPGLEWRNHLAIGAIALSQANLVSAYRALISVNSFLNQYIPTPYPCLSQLNVEHALIDYFGDPPSRRGTYAVSAYNSIKLYSAQFISVLPTDLQASLARFELPDFIITSRKIFVLGQRAYSASKAQRKAKAYLVANELPNLMVLARKRFKWLSMLDDKVRETVESASRSHIQLPVIFEVPGLENLSIMFTLWDRPSWIMTHKACYSSERCYRDALNKAQKKSKPFYFLQFTGAHPDSPWFLRALQLSLLGSKKPHSEEGRQYARYWTTKEGLFSMGCPSLGRQTIEQSSFMVTARSQARKLDATSVLFSVESLIGPAAIGLFLLTCLTQSLMRIGELMQVSLGQECVETVEIPQRDDATGNVRMRRIIYWKVFTKGADTRQDYIVSGPMLDSLLILKKIHNRVCGTDFQAVSVSQHDFSHSYRFDPEQKLKLVLQWAGVHLPLRTLQYCLDFILIEHPVRDVNGNPVRITHHLIRHAGARWLRKKGVSLEVIAKMLKHVNLVVTEDYSDESPEERFRQIGHILQLFGEIAGINPNFVRTREDIEHLEEHALKKYGVLRRTLGGDCGTLNPCQVHFKCASCPYFIPDPDRRAEVKEKEATTWVAIQFFENAGDYLQADIHKKALRDWQRKELEMDALAAVQLSVPPTDEFLPTNHWGKNILPALERPLALPPGERSDDATHST